jgi:hypothetical protein
MELDGQIFCLSGVLDLKDWGVTQVTPQQPALNDGYRISTCCQSAMCDMR